MKNKRPTLNAMLALLMFWSLLASGLLAGISYYILFIFGGVPPMLPQIMMPMIALAMCMLLGTAISSVASRRALRPVNRLIQATKKVAQGDFSVRVAPGEARGDLKTLVTSFNDMAGELGGIELFRKDFINNFSHEFKTPIVSIRGFARQLQRDDLTDAQRREYTGIIISESERLANMATNILLLTKLENQQIVSERAPFRLDEQIRSCVLMLEDKWSRRDIAPDLDLEEVTYVGNEEMMSHIWVNLIGNAIKFSPDGGEIRLRARAFEDMILIDVEDDGPGMDDEIKKHIFEKFYQADSARATEGNGLGLSLVGRIVNLCGGAVLVRSAPGEGSCFTVKLPYRPPEKGEKAAPKPDALPKG